MKRADLTAMREFVLPAIEKYLEGDREGEDSFFYDAPLALYFYASSFADIADPYIPATYAMLAGEALGLGSCMLGFPGYAMKESKALQAKYGLPTGARARPRRHLRPSGDSPAQGPAPPLRHGATVLAPNPKQPGLRCTNCTNDIHLKVQTDLSEKRYSFNSWIPVLKRGGNMTHPRAQALIEDYGTTTWLIHHLTDDLTQTESLLQPPFEANCLNWVVGHIVNGRNTALTVLGRSAAMG